jgi:uncharacterized membrane protein
MAAREDKAMTATANASASNGSDRLHGLDAVRGYALLLGIVFHATASFLPSAGMSQARKIPSQEAAR